MLGAGAWGTALAISLADRHAVSLWGRDISQLEILARERRNQRYLPDVEFPASLAIEPNFSVALANEKIFPELFVDMMSVGEQTGKLGDTMQMIAQVYERELDKQVKIISALIPPMIMLVIATVVGFVVFGILAAVFGMTSNLHPGGR